METIPIYRLLVHGSIVFLFGLISGFPFWLAIITSKSHETIRAWRVAHTTLIGCGLMMLVVGLAGPYLNLTTGPRALMEWSFVASGYAFIVALVAGAGLGRRGLVPTPAGINTLLFLGHLIGASGAIVGVILVLLGLISGAP